MTRALALRGVAAEALSFLDRDDVAFVGLLSLLALAATVSSRLLARSGR